VLDKFRDCLAVLIPLASMVWVLSIPQRLGLLVFPEQLLSLILAIAMALVYLDSVDSCPPRYNKLIGIGCATLSLLAGTYLAIRIPVLSEEAFFRPIETLIVSIIVIPLVVEALRRSDCVWFVCYLRNIRPPYSGQDARTFIKPG